MNSSYPGIRTLGLALALLCWPAVSSSASDRDLRVLVEGSKALYTKVIVQTDHATMHETPDPSGPGERISAFLVFHKLKSDDGREHVNGFTRVGDSLGAPVGWIKNEHLLEWNTRIVLYPLQAAVKDAAFTVYDDKSLSQESEYARLKKVSAGHVAICPVLSMPEGDEDRRVYEVAFFVGSPTRSRVSGDPDNAPPQKTAPTARTKNPITQHFYMILQAQEPGSMMGLSRGWAAEWDREGRRVAELRMLVAKNELLRLEGTLHFLYSHLEDASDPARRRNTKELIKILRLAVTGQLAGLEVSVDTPLAELISDLPLRTRVLEMSARDLATKSKKDFEAWLTWLKASRDRARQLLDPKQKANWLDLSGGLAGADRYTFLRIAELP